MAGLGSLHTRWRRVCTKLGFIDVKSECQVGCEWQSSIIKTMILLLSICIIKKTKIKTPWLQ